MVGFCNLAGAFGGSIAFGIGHINGAAGLEGFRWLFIIEGIITLLSAFLVVFCLPDYPARAKWLNQSDKQFAVDRLKARGGGYNQDHASRKELVETFFSPRMLAHYIAYVRMMVSIGFVYLLTSIPDRGCRAAGLLHFLRSHNSERTRLSIRAGSITHRTALGCRLLRCYYTLLFCRSFRCPGLAYYHRFHRWRHRLAYSWTFAS